MSMMQNGVNETAPIMQPQPLEQTDFMSLLGQKKFSDITLMVEGKPIYCH